VGDEPKLVWHRGVLAVSFTENGRRFRRSLGTDDIAIGKARLAEFTRQLSAQGKGGPVTIAAIYQAYVADRRAEGKSTTRIEDAWKRLAPTFGEMLPAHVDKDVCRDYAKARLADGVSNGTIHLELGYIRSAFIHAERANWITKAPFVWLPQKPPPRDHYITREEAEKLLEAAALPHVKLFIILALSTAGRSEALLGLTWDRVDFDRRRISLKEPGKAVTPKGRAVTPMNETAAKALLDARKGALTTHVIEWAGKPVQSIKKGLGAAGARIGVKVSPHVLRHSAAVWMAESGVPMAEIAQYLGHSSPATTYRVYARYSPDYLQKAAKSLELKVGL
jgi:integrase